MKELSHTNVVKLKHCFYTKGDDVSPHTHSLFLSFLLFLTLFFCLSSGFASLCLFVSFSLTLSLLASAR